MVKRKGKTRDKDKPSSRIPTLTEAVVLIPAPEAGVEEAAPAPVEEEPAAAPQPAWPDEQALAELRSTLTTQTIDLANQLMHSAMREMEAALLETVMDRLRQELPTLIDDVLNEQIPSAEAGTEDDS